jgi:hypothetical protein
MIRHGAPSANANTPGEHGTCRAHQLALDFNAGLASLRAIAIPPEAGGGQGPRTLTTPAVDLGAILSGDAPNDGRSGRLQSLSGQLNRRSVSEIVDPSPGRVMGSRGGDRGRPQPRDAAGDTQAVDDVVAWSPHCSARRAATRTPFWGGSIPAVGVDPSAWLWPHLDSEPAARARLPRRPMRRSAGASNPPRRGAAKERRGRRRGVNDMSFLAATGSSRILENGTCAGLMGCEQA